MCNLYDLMYHPSLTFMNLGFICILVKTYYVLFVHRNHRYQKAFLNSISLYPHPTPTPSLSIRSINHQPPLRHQLHLNPLPNKENIPLFHLKIFPSRAHLSLPTRTK